MKTLRSLFNRNDIEKKQDRLIRSLEGIGDILVFETKRQKNKLALEGLQKNNDIIKRLFEIQKTDPHKFEQIVVAREYLDFYKEDRDDRVPLLDSDKYLEVELASDEGAGSSIRISAEDHGR